VFSGGVDRSPLLKGAYQPSGSCNPAINKCQAGAQAGAIVEVVRAVAGPPAHHQQWEQAGQPATTALLSINVKQVYRLEQ
jgi:hypothetical protein